MKLNMKISLKLKTKRFFSVVNPGIFSSFTIPLLVLVLFQSGCKDSEILKSGDSNDLKYITSFEKGKLYKTSGAGNGREFNVLVLEGSWKEMGRQYGYLIRPEMYAFYEMVITDKLLADGVDYADITELSEYFYNMQFPYVKELLDGISETSGFSLEKVKIISSLIHIEDLDIGCSSLAVWDEYTSGNEAVVGRNWDLGGDLPKYKKFLTAVVYKPTDGKNSVVDINFAGIISMQTGMNNKGIFLDLQNGQRSDTNIIDDRIMPTYFLFDLMLNSSTPEDVDTKMLNPDNLPQLSLIINVTLPQEDVVFEWATYDVKKRSGQGVIASSNHFIDSSWVNLPEIPDGWAGDLSKERLANLLSLADSYKGSINENTMMDIFDVLYYDGGATLPQYTIYQTVAVPAKKTIWIKTPGISGWEKIDLRQIF